MSVSRNATPVGEACILFVRCQWLDWSVTAEQLGKLAARLIRSELSIYMNVQINGAIEAKYGR